jgi:hypothetical protein
LGIAAAVLVSVLNPSASIAKHSLMPAAAGAAERSNSGQPFNRRFGGEILIVLS